MNSQAAFLCQTILALFGFIGLIEYLSKRWRIHPIPPLILLGVALRTFGVGNGIMLPIGDIALSIMLFKAGLGFEKLLSQWKRMTIAGGLQMLTTSAGVIFIAHLLGLPWIGAVMIGVAISMSSTSVALFDLTRRDELETPQGTLSVLVLLFQDLALPGVALLSVILSPQTHSLGATFASLGIAIATLAGLAIGGYYLVLPLLDTAIKNNQRKLFMFSVVFFGLGCCLATYYAGVSFPLGGVVAGLIISRHETRYHAHGAIENFDVLGGPLVYVSIGTFVSLTSLSHDWYFVPVYLIVIVLVKFSCMLLTGFLMGHSLRTAGRTAATLSQVGEAAISILLLALAKGDLTPEEYAPWAATAVLSLILSPVITWAGNCVANLFAELPDYRFGIQHRQSDKDMPTADHVLVIGLGCVGHGVAYDLKGQGIQIGVLENNSGLLDNLRAVGVPFLIGDCAYRWVLEKSNISKARVIVVTFSNEEVLRHFIALKMELAPNVPLYIRTKYFSRKTELSAAGAPNTIVLTDEGAETIQTMSALRAELKLPRLNDEAMEQMLARLRKAS